MAKDRLRIKTCVLGQVGTNCYVVYEENGTEAVVIDPADHSAQIIEQCQTLGVTPKAVLLTHGHFDHILAAEDIKNQYDCPIYAGKAEDTLLRDPDQNLTGPWGQKKLSLQADILLTDQETVTLCGCEWQILFTPGHTYGSVCYYLPTETVLFSGDTLFEESLGRTDLPTGDSAAIVKSIQTKLFSLPADTMVYPGHGNPTTIGHEQEYNPVSAYRRRS